MAGVQLLGTTKRKKMTTSIASQIAKLLNERNQLVVEYDADRVLATKDNYVFDIENEKVVVCAECKKVQWYQWEISHVSVDKLEVKKGHGKKIIKKCESKAIDNRARIIQCTIRESNFPSIALFKSMGYKEVNKFYYPDSGNWVCVFQKCVSEKNS